MRMDKKLKECSEKLRALVSNVQGAPFPGNMNNELYNIWYEHIQSYAMECFEFLEAQFPKAKDDTEISKTLKDAF